MSSASRLFPFVLDQRWQKLGRIFFWLRWALLVGFVVPSVVCCALLAVYSGLSFARIPADVLQFAAYTARQPAAPAGYLSVSTCAGPVFGSATQPGHCRTAVVKQVAIVDLAQQAANYLWAGYVFIVLMTCWAVYIYGIFCRSRRAFEIRLKEVGARANT